MQKGHCQCPTLVRRKEHPLLAQVINSHKTQRIPNSINNLKQGVVRVGGHIPSGEVQPFSIGCQHNRNPVTIKHARRNNRQSFSSNLRMGRAPQVTKLTTMCRPARKQQRIQHETLHETKVGASTRTFIAQLQEHGNVKAKFIVSPNTLLFLKDRSSIISFEQLVSQTPQMLGAGDYRDLEILKLLFLKTQQRGSRNPRLTVSQALNWHG